MHLTTAPEIPKPPVLPVAAASAALHDAPYLTAKERVVVGAIEASHDDDRAILAKRRRDVEDSELASNKARRQDMFRALNM